MLDELACNLYAMLTRKAEYAENKFVFETAGCKLDDGSVGRLLETLIRGNASDIPQSRTRKDRITAPNSVGDKSEDAIPLLCIRAWGHLP
jgi:hypothetical protein